MTLIAIDVGMGDYSTGFSKDSAMESHFQAGAPE
jgi:hypothetical protein